jgi:hypothetical protein
LIGLDVGATILYALAEALAGVGAASECPPVLALATVAPTAAEAPSTVAAATATKGRILLRRGRSAAAGGVAGLSPICPSSPSMSRLGAHGALAGSGRAVTRNGQNLSKADDVVAKQL